ncbi:MAG: MATE family efflux transporter, partial [Clostridiaceae bacterium]|nr:MATE family efflux transporter [Clostridiaceae bacterium]
MDTNNVDINNTSDIDINDKNNISKSDSNNEVDMSSGSLLKKIIVFSIPLMLSGILQLLYNAADTIVVGRYAGSTALAAVGSTGSLINLIINLFMGLSVGTSVLVAQYYGARDKKNVSEVVHTAIGASVIFGIITSIIGISMARLFLQAMGTPEEVIKHSTLYMRIYFAGMPASMVYNFGSSILRAIGDTKRPLVFLSISGIVNVVLNLIFVIVFGMGVAGVAIATIIAQIISAVLIILCLIKIDGCYRLKIHEIKIYRDKLVKIMKIGIPAGLQSSIFSLSNVIIQSSVNSFGKLAMAGNTAGSNIDGLIYIATNSFYHSSLAFTGQNVGAKKYERIGRVLGICIFLATAVGFSLGMLSYVFGKNLLSIYSPNDAQVIEYGMIRLRIMGLTYFTCGIMEVIVGSLRGMGVSLIPMFVTVIGVCGVRIGWIYTVFAMNRTLEVLYMSYPASWVATASIHLICY